MPPAACRSVATKRPPGLRSQRLGVDSAIRSKSSMSSGTPASRATASRCRTPLVEPPEAATARIAFSSDVAGDQVARLLAASEDVHDQLAGRVGDLRTSSRPGPGRVIGPIGLMPIISNAIAIVLAVYWPPHAPAPGLAAASMSASSWSVILPAALRADGLEDVHDRDVAALVVAGRDASRRRASRRARPGARAPSRCRGSSCRRRTARSRRRRSGRASPARCCRRRPLATRGSSSCRVVPIVMPSEIATVLNSIGVPPAALMPSLTCLASARRWKLHGIVSIHVLAMPMIGFESASSS